jgi:hypothetical protein
MHCTIYPRVEGQDMNAELEQYEKGIVVYFKVQFQNFPGRSHENSAKLQFELLC